MPPRRNGKKMITIAIGTDHRGFELKNYLIQTMTAEQDNVQWLEVNREYSTKWPNITQNKDAMPEAEKYKDMPYKFSQFFS